MIIKSNKLGCMFQKHANNYQGLIANERLEQCHEYIYCFFWCWYQFLGRLFQTGFKQTIILYILYNTRRMMILTYGYGLFKW